MESLTPRPELENSQGQKRHIGRLALGAQCPLRSESGGRLAALNRLRGAMLPAQKPNRFRRPGANARSFGRVGRSDNNRQAGKLTGL